MVEFGKVNKKQREEKKIQVSVFKEWPKINSILKDKSWDGILEINSYYYVDDVIKCWRMPYNVTSRRYNSISRKNNDKIYK